jgi:hypothetical protein
MKMNLKYWLSYSAALAVIGFTLASIHLYYAAALRPTLSETLSQQGSTLSGQVPAVGPIRNLRFILFDAGIRPGEMRIKAGLVNLHIEDRTNSSQGVTLQRVLLSERVPLGTVQKMADQSRGRNSFRLTPGEYELFDVNRPTTKAVLLVEP